MKKQFFLILSFITFTSALQAQDVEQAKKRYRFAQTYFGLSSHFTLRSGKAVFASDDHASQAQTYRLPASLTPRFEIGGLHFWQFADFYISIPLVKLQFNTHDSAGINSSLGVITGARVHPWPLRPNKIRPHAGVAWSSTSFGQYWKGRENGPLLNRQRLLLDAGFSFTTKNWHIFNLSVNYLPNHSFDYHIDRYRTAETKLPPVQLYFGWKKAFDFTVGNINNHAYLKELDEHLLKNKKLNGFSIAAGYSSVINLRRSAYNKQQRPWLSNPENITLFADFGLGYYFQKPDAEVRLSYRNIRNGQQAYGFSQQTQRTSIGLEAFAFLGDYHGFVPFIGPMLSYEWLQLKEKDRDERLQTFSDAKPALGLVFGWDIRPTRAEWLLLRTNLRYMPQLNLNINSLTHSFSQLEFNFIQLVVYPSRLGARKQFNHNHNN